MTASPKSAPVKPTDACGHWIGVDRRYCRVREGLRRFPGLRCPVHTPAALAGRPEAPAGPGWPIHRQTEAP